MGFNPMDKDLANSSEPHGWDWFNFKYPQSPANEQYHSALSFARCFKGSDGAAVMDHLRRIILDRRLGPGASDAELRFLEGQRSVVAYVLSMIDRGSR
jgi:hypothetical protein